MKRTIWILPIAVALALGSASAGDVVFFHNGTTMEVRSHEIRGGMLHIDLGEDASIAFPEYMVERVEQDSPAAATAGKTTKPKPKRKRRPQPEPEPETAAAQPRNSPYKKTDSSINRGDARVTVDKNTGLAVYKPYARGQHRAKRQLASSGSQFIGSAPASTRSVGGVKGATPKGNKFVIPKGPQGARNRSSRPPITGLEFTRGTSTAKPESGSQGSGQGSGN